MLPKERTVDKWAVSVEVGKHYEHCHCGTGCIVLRIVLTYVDTARIESSCNSWLGLPFFDKEE